MGWQEDLAAAMQSGALEGLSDESNGSFRAAGSKVNAPSLEISSEELQELLVPWASYDRDNNQPNYIGRNEQAWIKDNNRIRNLLVKADETGKPESYARSILRNNGFTNEAEQFNILRNLYNKKYKNKLHTEHIWVPGAVSDEFLSQKLLQYAGFSPVKLENASGDPMATDLRVTIDGAPRMMDAQSRVTGSNLNLEALLYDGAARQYVLDHPNQALGESLKVIADRYPGVKEGKYLHTDNPDFNPILSNKVVGKPRHHKEFLISSNRRGMSSGGKTPYNRELPRNWDVVDLEKAREILNSMSPAKMYEKYKVEARGGRYNQALILDMPQAFIQKELSNRNFDTSDDSNYGYAKRRLSKQSRRR